VDVNAWTIHRVSRQKVRTNEETKEGQDKNIEVPEDVMVDTVNRSRKAVPESSTSKISDYATPDEVTEVVRNFIRYFCKNFLKMSLSRIYSQKM
jgi:hypothetical protein